MLLACIMRIASPTMARIPRKFILQDQSYFHVTWKCHNEEHLLQNPQVKQKLHDLLKAFKAKYRIKIFGYCFMDNHPHLVGYCETRQEFSRFFQVVNGQIARFINRGLSRRGQVIMDRMRSPQIESDKHLLSVLRYVDLNPVRAGLCRHPQNYRWSSYRALALGYKDPLLDPLPDFISLEPDGYLRLHAESPERNDQNELRFFSKCFFIGTPDWVRKRQAELAKSLFLSKQHASPPLPPSSYKENSR